MSRPVRMIARHTESGAEYIVARDPVSRDWFLGQMRSGVFSGRFLARRFDSTRRWAQMYGYQLVSAGVPRE